MKISKVMMLALLVQCGSAEAQVFQKPLRQDPSRAGLFNGSAPVTNAAIKSKKPEPIVEDWRKIDGKLYNVAVKQSYDENLPARGGWRKSGLSGSANLLPGWERIQGTVRAKEGKTIKLEISGNRRAMVRDYPWADKLTMHLPTVIYAYRRSDGIYDHGTQVSAEEAKAELAKRNESAAALAVH